MRLGFPESEIARQQVMERMDTANTPDTTRPRRRILGVLPDSWRVLPLIWPFLVIVIILLMLSAESMSILVATRS